MLPPVIKNLIIINTLAFLAYVSLSQVFRIDLNDIFGMHYVGSEKFSPYQMVTYMFMHGGIGHLFFNMFALWMFGNNLENYWGPKKFLIYYFVTGIGAVLIHFIVLYIEISPVINAIDTFLLNPSLTDFKVFMESDFFKIASYDIQNHYNQFSHNYNNIVASNPNKALQQAIYFMNEYRVDYLNAPVVVGASGAVFGLLLAFGMMWPNSVIYLYFAIPIKTKYFVIMYGALELYSGISASQGDNVAHFAHLGGMIFGFILIMFWKKKEKTKWM
ncbi:MAG: rhomboid family intramembrane serine protease [Bacteroidales bacterium]|nr:rhomboid family intramembrane serine protease [Bacteroidales bacterium]MBN2756143.1 rhomboid family intramembrane serine protease [Bacteroidales bacterium]